MAAGKCANLSDRDAAAECRAEAREEMKGGQVVMSGSTRRTP